jgi:3-oxoacyl-[acyl-carrier-protein] synthase III
LNPAYISALAALAGATIGGLTSFATSWLTQRTQLRHAHREAERVELKTLYSDFITEAARVFVDALTHQTEEIAGLVGLYAMVGRMGLVSDQTVIAAAIRIEETIVETYLGPNRTLPELMEYAHQGKLSILIEFSEACRKDLAARATAIR